jgi:hypothetical protein
LENPELVSAKEAFPWRRIHRAPDTPEMVKPVAVPQGGDHDASRTVAGRMDELILPEINADMGKGFPVGVEEQEVAGLALLHGHGGEGSRHFAGTAREVDAVLAVDMVHEATAVKPLLGGVASAPVRSALES